MFEHIKKRIIKGLIEEIACLGATEIELVGHKYISLREGKPFIHHGINKDYMPSGYTVDTFSDDSTIVGEYSAEKGYFDYTGENNNPVYKKINKDIVHAISHKNPSGPDKIYLISNQEENPSFRAKFNATENGELYGDRLIIIDARELAKGIYEQSLNNPSSADFYKQYFPTFSQNLDNYEYFGKLPNVCEGYISEPNILNAITSHYEKRNCICVLYGVSGAGKTQAAIDFIHKNSNQYTNYIWIGGEDWKENSALSSVQRTRGGSPVNVAGLFNSEKSILVIDNCNRVFENNNFEELKSGFDRGGVVLVSSQISDPQSPLYLSIPRFSKASALKILGESGSAVSQKCSEFISKCSFSPLILSITKKLALEQGVEKEGIYDEILNDPELVGDYSGSSIIKKILNRLEKSTINALKIISNSGQNFHDAEFLRHFAGVLNCNTLQKLSILVPENTIGVLRIHDLIAIAVQDNIDCQPIASSIESYISQKNGDMTPSVLRQIHLCSDQLFQEHLRRGNREIDWIHYALLQIEGNKKIDLHNDIHILEVTTKSSLATIKCVMDAKEIHSYTIPEIESRQAYYKECVAIYTKVLQEEPTLDKRLELLHHKGKAQRRCGQYCEALSTFNDLLELKPEWHATHGQIAHLGTLRNVDSHVRKAGEKSMLILLQDIESDSFTVPLRVSLAAFARLRSYREITQDINQRNESVKKLANVIVMSALEGLDQFYEAFVSFTSMFGYKHSATCTSIAEAIPEMTAIPPNLVESKQWVSACESLTNASIAAGRENKISLSNRLIGAGLSFANEIIKRKQLSSYEARCVAKAYNIGSKPEKAIEIIQKIPEDQQNHWLLYEQAKAYLELGDDNYQSALSSAEKCFEMAQSDDKSVNRISIYHDLLSRCHEFLKDYDNAIKELKKAVENCSDEKYKAELEVRLSNLK
ncbi:MAG: tetratricopeptide repeat protein [Candidatus Electrothrix aestuarii]|uniref:Tetratricopeptide repeat protein n=1 Tax=Candidatus Electrothrix aestuarii TaxID=3062594 RepID=A0AAU8LZ77_9BACT|nr:tetratricopeptide repeat protein [Candidatus Electrothrix aestuarii]